MGSLRKQKPVKLITSIIFKEDKFCECAEESLIMAYGKIESFQKVLPFDYTDYYCKEFGKPLKRKLVCFEKLVNIENIYKVKLKTNKIEDHFRKSGNRTVNVDPGYITEAKLVLLTTKDYTHRIYVGREVFAESTLAVIDGTFRSWPWTYPDYASRELISYFNEVRKIYGGNLKKRK